jgi:hypothetical protein
MVLSYFDESLSAASAAQNDERAAMFGMMRHFVLTLTGGSRAIGRFDPLELADGDLKQLQDGRHTAGLWTHYATRTAIVFGDSPGALRASRAHDRPASYRATVLLKWAHAMALSHALRGADPIAREALLAELAPMVDWLERRMQIVPANTVYLVQQLRAMRAWADGDVSTAAREFQAAIDSATRHPRPGHRALACELAGELFAAIGAVQAADAYLQARAG